MLLAFCHIQGDLRELLLEFRQNAGDIVLSHHRNGGNGENMAILPALLSGGYPDSIAQRENLRRHWENLRTGGG